MAKKRDASTLGYSSSFTGNSIYNPASLRRNNTSNASDHLSQPTRPRARQNQRTSNGPEPPGGRRMRRKTVEDHESYVESSPQPEDSTDGYHRAIPKREVQHLKAHEQRLWKSVKLPVQSEQIRQAQRDAKSPEFDYDVLLFDDGYLAIIDAAHKEARDAKHPWMRDTAHRSLSKIETWRFHGLQILASVPYFLLKAFYSDQSITQQLKAGDQNLQQLFYTSNSDAENSSDWVQRYGEAFAPSLYAREVVDQDGIPLTPIELTEVIKVLRDYVSGNADLHKQNAKIDSLSSLKSSEEDIAEGYHVFLRGVPDRVVTLLTFCNALEKQLAEVDLALHGEPFLPLMYVGFAAVAQHRFKDYSDERNQSWLTELFIMACRFLFGNKFRLENYVICFTTSHEECQIGEELFTRSGRAYAETGLGFGVAAAGVNVSSSDLKGHTAGTMKQQWAKSVKFRKQAYFDENMTRELKRHPAYEKKIKRIRAERNSDRVIRQKEANLDKLHKEIRESKRNRVTKDALYNAVDKLHESQKKLEGKMSNAPKGVLRALVDMNKRVREQHEAEIDELSDDSSEESEDE